LFDDVEVQPEKEKQDALTEARRKKVSIMWNHSVTIGVSFEFFTLFKKMVIFFLTKVNFVNFKNKMNLFTKISLLIIVSKVV
jgi:hypothetical protein